MIEASTSVEICPSATFVPFVAMSLGLPEEALAAAGREISAPVHVDSSFAARGHPTGEFRLRREKPNSPPNAGVVRELVRGPGPAAGSSCETQDRRIQICFGSTLGNLQSDRRPCGRQSFATRVSHRRAWLCPLGLLFIDSVGRRSELAQSPQTIFKPQLLIPPPRPPQISYESTETK